MTSKLPAFEVNYIPINLAYNRLTLSARGFHKGAFTAHVSDTGVDEVLMRC